MLLKRICVVLHDTGWLLYIMSAVYQGKDTKERLKNRMLGLNFMKENRFLSIVYCEGLTLYTIKGLFSGFKNCKMLESIFVFFCICYKLSLTTMLDIK